jgi:hypothetical protein
VLNFSVTTSVRMESNHNRRPGLDKAGGKLCRQILIERVRARPKSTHREVNRAEGAWKCALIKTTYVMRTKAEHVGAPR